MADDTQVSDEVSAITKAAARQAHEAADAYFDLLKKAISSFPSGGTKLGKKLKSHAEQNIAALQEYVTKLSEVRTIQDAIRIQTEFVQSQFAAFGEQARDLMDTYAKEAETAIKVPSP